jgi:hypothetical protein
MCRGMIKILNGEKYDCKKFSTTNITHSMTDMDGILSLQRIINSIAVLRRHV